MSQSIRKPAQEVMRHSCAEVGTAIFAFFNVLASSICLFICLNIMFMYIWESWNETDVIDSFMWTMCLSFNFVAFVTNAFAIILFIGINKKKSGYVLAYCIFGVIVVISIVAALVALNYIAREVDMNKNIRQLFNDYYESVTQAVVGICVAYALMLTMICRTWFLMTSRGFQYHEKLVEDFYGSDWRVY